MGYNGLDFAYMVYYGFDFGEMGFPVSKNGLRLVRTGLHGLQWRKLFLSGLQWVTMSENGLRWVRLCLQGLNRAGMGSNEARLGYQEFDWVSPGLSGFRRVLAGWGRLREDSPAAPTGFRRLRRFVGRSGARSASVDQTVMSRRHQSPPCWANLCHRFGLLDRIMGLVCFFLVRGSFASSELDRRSL